MIGREIKGFRETPVKVQRVILHVELQGKPLKDRDHVSF